MKNNTNQLGDMLATFEQECKKNQIALFRGTMDETMSNCISVDFDGGNWRQYLDFLKAVKAKIVIVDPLINDFDEEEYFSKKIDEMEQEDKKNYLQSLKVVKKVQGQIAKINLSYIDGNTIFNFAEISDWYHDYLSVTDLDEEDDDEEVLIPNTDEIPKLQIEKVARLVIKSSKYQNAQTEFARRKIASTLDCVADVNGWGNLEKIITKAEEIFNDEIFPDLENQLRQKILDLKSKGFKKLAVKGKLNIKDAVINRHWYEEQESSQDI